MWTVIYLIQLAHLYNAFHVNHLISVTTITTKNGPAVVGGCAVAACEAPLYCRQCKERGGMPAPLFLLLLLGKRYQFTAQFSLRLGFTRIITAVLVCVCA